jgi:hypothetical protein
MAESEGQGEITLTIEKTSKDGTVTVYNGKSNPVTGLVTWFRERVTPNGDRNSNERG